MTTRIGVIAEGLIDHALIQPILGAVARDRAAYTWPVRAEDAADWIQVRARGHGGVWLAVKRLVRVLEKMPDAPHRFYLILLDRRTRPIQEKVRKLIAGKTRFVLGIAQEEIEAWWLADRERVLEWLNFNAPPPGTRYAGAGYRAERDDDPKRTLDELTRKCPGLDRAYGEGNLDLAREFVERWEGRVGLKRIEAGCPRRFPPFCKASAGAFARAKRDEGRVL